MPADKQRLDWLDKNGRRLSMGFTAKGGDVWYWTDQQGRFIPAQSLREAIDAAIAHTPHGGGPSDGN